MRSVRHRLRHAALFVAAATLATLGSAVPCAAPGQAAENKDFWLFPASTAGTVDGLDRKLYRDTVPTVLRRANRKATGSCRLGALKNVRTSWYYCFDAEDSQTLKWTPQGVTGVSDARLGETWQGTKPLAVSWYHSDHCRKKVTCGVRISFLDTRTGRYRHVLLVEPKVNSAHHYSYDAVSVHAGGIAWYGNYLYVADTSHGLRVFDVRRIFDLDPDGNPATDDRQQDRDVRSNATDTGKVGRHDNVFYGLGYRYVMPQVRRYFHRAATGACGVGRSRHSYVSVDRSTAPDTLVTGEYCTKPKHVTTPHHGRVARYAIDQGTGLLRMTGSGPFTRAVPGTVYQLPDWYVQGAANYRGTWYLNRSHNCTKKSNGTLILATAGRSGQLHPVASRTVATGPEDLSVWRARQDIVSVSEHSPKEKGCYPPNTGRAVYAVHI